MTENSELKEGDEFACLVAAVSSSGQEFYIQDERYSQMEFKAINPPKSGMQIGQVAAIRVVVIRQCGCEDLSCGWADVELLGD